MRKVHLTVTLLTAATLALGGCSSKTPSADSSSAAADTSATVPAVQSLSDALDNTDGLQTMAEALKETGLSDVFDGNASYTLLAPEDDAFASLGDAGKQITTSSDNAPLAALIRDHMLPGYVTPQDLNAAINASKDGQVSMTTLGGNVLTFSRTTDGGDDAITVTAPDGSQAMLDGDPVAGGASLAIPITGVLEKV